MEKFSLGTTIVSGSGAVSFLETLHAKRVFLVTDPYFRDSGKAAQVLLKTGASETEIFSEVTPDPTVELAAKGTAAFQAFRPDLLLALGGGSAMDCAKAIACFAKSDIPLAAIPTTSGSGSEVTDFAILTHGGIKHPLVDPSLQPDYAILDSDLLDSLPGSLIADAGFDVLSHAAEAYVAKNAGTLSDLYAKEAFRIVFENLRKSYTGDRSVRLLIHQGATMAGIGFTQSGLGLCHALSHSLGGAFHVPHGRLNAILLPAVVEANSRAAGKKYAELSRSAGLGATADSLSLRNLKSGLIRLRQALNLPGTLAEAGVKPSDVHSRFHSLVDAAVKDPCAGTNPEPVTKELAARVLSEVTGRG